MPKQPRRPRKFIVRVPITLMLCAEVMATDKEKAIDQATYEVDELTPLFHGYGDHNMDRPPMLGIESSSDGPNMAWFEGYEQSGIFNGGKASRK